jgi:glycosyltransferase involved in cell wall biosynthesis
MLIGIEAQRLFRINKHGMDIYALELIRHLQMIDKVNNYVLFIRPDKDDIAIKESENLRIVKLKGLCYPFWEQIALPLAARKAGCQLLHCTSNTAPFFTSIPLIVTLHDIIFMENGVASIIYGSGTWYQKFGNIYRKLVVPRIIWKSSKIITVSEFEKKCISDFFGLNDDMRLTAIYNGVSSHFNLNIGKAELKRVREKYGLPEKYIFFLGNTDPKKNTLGTLKAFSDFLDQTSEKIKLVMLDFEKKKLEKLLLKIGKPLLMNMIVLTGYVPNTDLPAIYTQSALFLYPSIRESFGIPILEAMACGIPVITSNTASMPEIAGNAAILTDPLNPPDLTAAMIRILSDKSLKDELSGKGLKQASRFNWKAMAQEVVSIYGAVGASERKSMKIENQI